MKETFIYRDEDAVIYKLDGTEKFKSGEIIKNFANVESCGGWRSPLFMPEWASRKKFTIKDLWPERLQDITEVDAKAKGVGEQAQQAM